MVRLLSLLSVALVAVVLLTASRGSAVLSSPASESSVAAFHAVPQDTLTDEQLRALGRGIYDEYCADCHGADWEGGLAGSLSDGEWMYADGDSESLEQIVRVGIEDEDMPPWGDVLSDDEVRGLVLLVLHMEEQADKP